MGFMLAQAADACPADLGMDGACRIPHPNDNAPG